MHQRSHGMISVGIDIDGVLAQTCEAVLEAYNRSGLGSPKSLADMRDYDFTRSLDIPEPALHRFLADLERRQLWSSLALYEGCQELLTTLVARGLDLFYITARPPRLEEITRRWIDDRGLPALPLYMSGPAEKVSFCREVGRTIEVLVDDSPQNAQEATLEGVVVFLIDRPWNSDFAETQGIRRVSCYRTLEDMILELLSQRPGAPNETPLLKSTVTS